MEVESFRQRSNAFERHYCISEETREFENKEQTVSKELESFRRRSNPLERG